MSRNIRSSGPRRLLRLTIACVWLYEGLWLKVVVQAPRELAVVAALPSIVPMSSRTLLASIGWGETLLAIGVLSGLYQRPLAVIQLLLVLAMNGLGILFAAGTAITDPLALVVRNLPFLACIVMLGRNRR